MIAEARIVRYHFHVAKRKFVCFSCAVVLIMLLFQMLSVSLRSPAIAQEALREHCYSQHSDPGAYRMAYDKAELWGHYYDFSLAPPPPGSFPGEMGFYRVYVTWFGTTSVGGIKGRPW